MTEVQRDSSVQNAYPKYEVGVSQSKDIKKVLAFVNPSSRSGKGCGEILTKWAKERNLELLNPQCGESGEDVSELFHKYHQECDVVIVGGGDGSVNFVLPYLLQYRLPVLVLPLGTANNLARTLNLPLKIEEALELLEKGQKKKIDVGLVNGLPFLNVVGLGLSSQINKLTHTKFKRGFGVFAFIGTGLMIARRMIPFRIWVQYDGKKHFARSFQLTICNGRNYGSGLTIDENASFSDEKLHGLSTEVTKWWHGFFLIPAAMRGKFRPEHDVTCFSGREIFVETSHPRHVDVDGDIKTKTPLKLSVLPKALEIFVSRESVH